MRFDFDTLLIAFGMTVCAVAVCSAVIVGYMVGPNFIVN
jgi:hypothetical protein